MINNTSLSYVRTNALNPDKVDCLIEHGWEILGSGASIGDSPRFLLFKQHIIPETDYDSRFRHHEVQ